MDLEYMYLVRYSTMILSITLNILTATKKKDNWVCLKTNR